MLGWSRHFIFSDILKISSKSFGDASKNIGKAALMFALNAYVIAKFGSEMLPVLAVVVMTIGISEMFDGVANAAQPLASVYIGEKNPLLTRRVMHAALVTALVEGGGIMLLLLAFPGLMLSLFLRPVLPGVSFPSRFRALRSCYCSTLITCSLEEKSFHRF